ERFFTNIMHNRLCDDYDKSECPQEVLDTDLLCDFREQSVFDRYCEKYKIQTREIERERLVMIYGTQDFDKYLQEDFSI
ncbi:MAG: hypothetical protein NC489_28745, partial [Ruminococcus flavefaciens]|nr:hypothetical protein [Ruminococcus flavefaciens]